MFIAETIVATFRFLWFYGAQECFLSSSDLYFFPDLLIGNFFTLNSVSKFCEFDGKILHFLTMEMFVNILEPV